MLFRSFIIASIAIFQTSGAFATEAKKADNKAPAMVRISAEDAKMYGRVCKLDGNFHACPKGDVAAIFGDKVVCRPDPATYPFAKQGEKPCVNNF